MGQLRSFEKEVFASYHGTKIGDAVVGPPVTPGSAGPIFDWTNGTFVAFRGEIGLALLLIIKTYSSGLIGAKIYLSRTAGISKILVGTLASISGKFGRE